MTISFNPRQKSYVSASPATLKLPAQEPFLRNVARILARCAQPVSMNDVIHTVSLCLSNVASADVIISRCCGDTNDSDDRRIRRY